MLSSIRDTVFLNNTLSAYAASLIIFLFVLLTISIFKRIFLVRIKNWTEKTQTTIDDFIIKMFESTFMPFLYFAAFYLAAQSLTLPGMLRRGINITAVFLITILGIRFLTAAIVYVFETYWIKREKDIKKEKSLKGMLSVIKTLIWGIGIIFLLDNLGFNISSVIAGLGIGGVAVALAAQAVLGDLFSYISILFDRPFEIGDFIIIGDYLGAVEHIGIKTTRIRSLGGEQLVFSNTDLTNSRVRNYKRMAKRRVVFKLGVTYQTPLSVLKEIPGIIKQVIETTKDTVFDRAHFFSYGDFSLVFEVVYYIIGSDYNKYMDIQQEINFAVKDEFEKRGIEFAYPTQTVFIQK